MHLVFRSTRAKGSLSFLHRRNRSRIESLLHTRAQAAGIRVYRMANVGNHLHVLIKAPSCSAFQGFLRSFAGLGARLMTGARKGLSTGRFWDAPAYSRVVHWGRHFAAAKAYLEKNRLEAIGFLGARLRIRANGELVVVVGDPDVLGDASADARQAIRGGPG